MVPTLSLVLMVVTLVICLVLPLGGWFFLQTRRTPDGDRRYPLIWRPVLCGALAFFISQMLLRLPLMSVVVPMLAEPVRGWLTSAPVASLSAGLFEETGRLVVMVLLLQGFRRWIDGIGFGLGHGGLEAIVLIGMAQVNNLILALVINMGRWDQVASQLPPDSARIRETLVHTSPVLFLAAGVERIASITIHIGCSLLVLWGVYRGRRLLAWGAAVLLHAATNLMGVWLLPVSPYLSEAGLIAIAVVVVVVALRSRHRFAPDLIRPATAHLGPPAEPVAPDPTT